MPRHLRAEKPRLSRASDASEKLVLRCAASCFNVYLLKPDGALRAAGA